jgi:hypothetical protein
MDSLIFKKKGRENEPKMGKSQPITQLVYIERYESKKIVR